MLVYTNIQHAVENGPKAAKVPATPEPTDTSTDTEVPCVPLALFIILLAETNM